MSETRRKQTEASITNGVTTKVVTGFVPREAIGHRRDNGQMESLLAAQRQRLEQQAGIERPVIKHFHRPVERPFTAAERDKVTLLFGGLTWKHEKLMKAVFEGNGYRCQDLPVPDVAAFQLGKEYGNNGQCNPTYFTVGNLVQYLQRLEASGMATPCKTPGSTAFACCSSSRTTASKRLRASRG